MILLVHLGGLNSIWVLVVQLLQLYFLVLRVLCSRFSTSFDCLFPGWHALGYATTRYIHTYSKLLCWHQHHSFHHQFFSNVFFFFSNFFADCLDCSDVHSENFTPISYLSAAEIRAKSFEPPKNITALYSARHGNMTVEQFLIAYYEILAENIKYPNELWIYQS